MSLPKSAPNVWLVDLGGILQPPINGYHVLDQNIHGHYVLVVLLIDSECLLEETVVRSNLGDLTRVVILELIDITDNLALIGTDSSKKQEILQVAIVAE